MTQFEGGQQTTGYVPKKKSGAVVGNSGVTVATGFDVGQKNPAGIQALGLSNELTGRLTPYAAMTKNAAVSYLAEHPLEVSRAEAMDIDRAVKSEHLSAAIASWNRLRPAGTPAFADLTPAQQTVIFSRTFHQGVGLPKDKTALPFYAAAQANRWADAETNLRNYRVEEQWYKDRVAKEANLLKAERDKNAN